jgi:hypothetical protein
MNWFLVLYFYTASPGAARGYDWNAQIKAAYATEAACKEAAKAERLRITPLLKDDEGAAVTCVPETALRKQMGK